MDDQVVLLLRIGNADLLTALLKLARIANLATAFRVEGRLIQY